MKKLFSVFSMSIILTSLLFSSCKKDSLTPPEEKLRTGTSSNGFFADRWFYHTVQSQWNQTWVAANIPPGHGGILYLGDFQIDNLESCNAEWTIYYSGLPAINRGTGSVGWNHTTVIDSAYINYRTRISHVGVMLGTQHYLNDNGATTNGTVWKNSVRPHFQAYMAKLRSKFPTQRITIWGIPRTPKLNQLGYESNHDIDSCNRMYMDYASAYYPNVYYSDPNNTLAQPGGTNPRFLPDNTSLALGGYEKIRNSLQSFVSGGTTYTPVAPTAVVSNIPGNTLYKQRSSATISFDGSTSFDTDGQIVSYKWTQVSGLTLTINTPNAATTTLTRPAAGWGYSVRKFKLEVTDEEGNKNYREFFLQFQGL